MADERITTTDQAPHTTIIERRGGGPVGRRDAPVGSDDAQPAGIRPGQLCRPERAEAGRGLRTRRLEARS